MRMVRFLRIFPYVLVLTATIIITVAQGFQSQFHHNKIIVSTSTTRTKTNSISSSNIDNPKINNMSLQTTNISRILSTVPRGGSATSLKAAMDLAPILQSTTVYVAADIFGFLVSIISGGSHVHLDLIGSGAFAIAGIPQMSSSITRVKWSATAMALWGGKLAAFLFFRATQTGRDRRLESTLSTTSGTAGFWFLTLAWQIISSLPHLLGSSSPLPGNDTCLKLGTFVYGAGLLMETTADLQKYFFKKSNPGKFCNVGVWKISQHPNFFGNILLWSGILIMNAPALVVDEPANNIFQHIWRFRYVLLSLATPLSLYNLFYAQASGGLSSSLKVSKSKYGSDPEFQRYIKEVPLIFPKIFR